MKRIFVIFALIMFLVCVLSCVTQRNVTNNDIMLGASIKYALVIDNATFYQVDSLITADNLPNINKWIGGSFIDYETGNKITKRMYIKKGGEESFVYVIMGNNEPFKITKRVEE